jgi:hypothetical protein
MWRVGNTPPAGRQSSFPVVASDPWAVVSEEDEEIDPPMAQISQMDYVFLCDPLRTWRSNQMRLWGRV